MTDLELDCLPKYSDVVLPPPYTPRQKKNKNTRFFLFLIIFMASLAFLVSSLSCIPNVITFYHSVPIFPTLVHGNSTTSCKNVTLRFPTTNVIISLPNMTLLSNYTGSLSQYCTGCLFYNYQPMGNYYWYKPLNNSLTCTYQDIGTSASLMSLFYVSISMLAILATLVFFCFCGVLGTKIMKKFNL